MTNMPSSLTLASASRISTATPSVPAGDTGPVAAPQSVSRATQAAVPVKDRLESLLADQVKSGSLTDDQASELKSLFAEAAAPQPAAPAPADDETRQSGGLDTLSNKLDRMSALLDKMRTNMAQGAGYSAGATPPAASAGMVFNGIA